MKDFVCIGIDSNISDDLAYEYARRALPEFNWRRGDSDMQGPYLSGGNADHAQIKIWLGEKPFEMSVSFRNAWLNVPEREERKEALIGNIVKNLIPNFGNIVKMDA